MRFVLILKSRSLPQSATADSSLSEGALDKYAHLCVAMPDKSQFIAQIPLSWQIQTNPTQTNTDSRPSGLPYKSQFITQIPLSWYLQTKFAKKHRLIARRGFSARGFPAEAFATQRSNAVRLGVPRSADRAKFIKNLFSFGAFSVDKQGCI